MSAQFVEALRHFNNLTKNTPKFSLAEYLETSNPARYVETHYPIDEDFSDLELYNPSKINGYVTILIRSGILEQLPQAKLKNIFRVCNQEHLALYVELYGKIPFQLWRPTCNIEQINFTSGSVDELIYSNVFRHNIQWNTNFIDILLMGNIIDINVLVEKAKVHGSNDIIMSKLLYV